jgi:OmpA-OmpF porin, OOP family
MITNFLKKSAAAATIAMLFSGGLYAQDTTSVSGSYPKPFSSGSFRTWSIGINGGVLFPVVPFGKNDFTTSQIDLGYGAFLKKQISPDFAIQADFLAGTLKGDNTEKWGDGTTINSPWSSFETKLKYSGSLSANFSLGNIDLIARKVMVTPYITAGAGLMSYKTTLTDNANVQSDFSPKDEIRELFFPVGAGLKFTLSKGINLNLGYNMNFVDADNVDGYRVGPQTDKFSYGHMGLEFALGSKSKMQLTNYSPIAALEYDYMTQNAALKSELDALSADRKLGADNANRIAQLDAELKKMQTDADKDGVSDYFDKCPNTPAGSQVDGSGCPIKVTTTINNPVKIVVTEEDKKVVNEAIRNLEFDTGKATIRATSFPSLDKVADLLVKKNFSLQLAGHTDNVGKAAANLKLSKDRAESIKAYLVSKGANPSRISATGYGAGQPIASNKTEEGRQQNRRVEFTLL